MSVEFAYFKSVKAKSVAIMGGNNKHIFYLEKPTKVTDPGDIYIFRKKAEKVIETDEYGQPLDPNANDYIQTEQGVVRRRSAPRSHITYGGLQTAKRKQLEAEQRMKAKEVEKPSEEDEEEKQSIDDELSAEDDLNVDDDDFDFEEEKGKKKIKKSKKFTKKESSKSKSKKSSKKKTIKKKTTKKKKSTSSTKKPKTEKPEKKKDIKSRLNKLRGFRT